MASHWEIVAAGNIRASNNPKELWENACSYFKWMDDNPKVIPKTITSGKEAGRIVTEHKILPYSIKALCLHCGIEEEYLKDVRNGIKEDPYYQVVSKILYIIYTQNYEMAVVGEYNAIFTAKVLNIDKDDSPKRVATVNIVTGLPTLSTSENEVLEKLEMENRDFGN